MNIEQQVKIHVYDRAADAPGVLAKFFTRTLPAWLPTIGLILAAAAALILVIMVIKNNHRKPHFWRSFALSSIFLFLTIFGFGVIHLNGRPILTLARATVHIDIIKDQALSGSAESQLAINAQGWGAGYNLYAEQPTKAIAVTPKHGGDMAYAMPEDSDIQLSLLDQNGQTVGELTPDGTLLNSEYSGTNNQETYTILAVVGAGSPSGTATAAIDYTAEARDTLISSTAADRMYRKNKNSEEFTAQNLESIKNAFGIDDAEAEATVKALDHTTAETPFEPTLRYTVKILRDGNILKDSSGNEVKDAQGNTQQVIKQHRWLNAPDPVRRESIREITFQNTFNAGDLAKPNCWDISQTQAGTVIACYTVQTANINGIATSDAYNITISQENGVSANEDSSYLFYYIGRNDVDIAGISEYIKEAVNEVSEECPHWYSFLCHSKNAIFSGAAALGAVYQHDIDQITQTAYNTNNYSKLNDLANLHTDKTKNMSYMFAGAKFTNLADVISNTQLTTDQTENMSHMFEDTGLHGDGEARKDVNGGKLTPQFTTTAAVKDFSGMFESSWFSEIDVANFDDTSQAENMRAMFANTQKLHTALNIAKFDTSKVKDMSMLFSHSKTPKIVWDNTKFNTKKVRNMSYMFAGITVSALELEEFDTSNVTDMSYMFAGASITSLDLSKLNLAKLTQARGMFMGAGGGDDTGDSDRAPLIATFPDDGFNAPAMTDTSWMFAYSNLQAANATTLYFATPTNKTGGKKITDMNHMFYGAYHTDFANFAKFDTSEVTDMSYMFANYTPYYTGDNLTGTGECQNQLENDHNVTDHQSGKCGVVVVSALADDTPDINDDDADQKYDSDYTDPTIQIQDFDKSPYSNDIIDLSKFKTNNVKNMEGMFAGNNASEVWMRPSTFLTPNVTNMAWMYAGIEIADGYNFDFSYFDTAGVKTMEGMFAHVHLEDTLDLSHFKVDNLKDLRFMFYEANIIGVKTSQKFLDKMADKATLISFMQESSNRVTIE